MPLIDVYRERKFYEVMEDTFGHLEAKPGRYPGFMVLTWAGYGGDTCIVNAEFAGVEDSPWLMGRMEAYLDKLVDEEKVERGHVYRFLGEYVLYKSGSYRFVGNLAKVI